MSYITINQLNGLPVVVNVTFPNHVLDPGIVVRQASVNSQGQVVIDNWGEGTSKLQSPTNTLGVVSDNINGVWNSLYPPK